MKKTFPVNINGKVFYIDEDAYELLLNYLEQLRSAFSSEEGDEIVTDIESRISELFDERIAAGANAIVYADVNRVIEIMGKPSDISDDEGQQPHSEINDEIRQDNTPQPEAPKSDVRIQKRLYRNLSDKIFGGVFGGLAAYLDWDANIMRVLYVVLAIFTHVWPLTILYLVAWMIIPPANTPRRVLEMQGLPVTVDSIGQNVLSSTPPPYNGQFIKNHSNIISSFFSMIGKCIMGVIGLVGVCGALVATGFFLFFTVAMIAYICFGSVTLISEFDYGVVHSTLRFAPVLACAAYLCFSLTFIIPSVALAWTAASALFNAKGAAKTTIIFAFILELIVIVATIILMIFLNNVYYSQY